MTAVWAFRNKEIKGTFHWKETCSLCNRWILKNEDFYMLIPPKEIADKYPIGNILVHKDEWDKFVEGLSDEEIANKLMKHKKPRKKPLTEEQLKRVEFFKEACEKFGFSECTMSKDKRFVKMKKRRTSYTFIYDIIFERIDFDSRRDTLFGSLYIVEVQAKIRNEYYRLSGVNKHDDFTVAGIVDKAIEQVDEMMGKRRETTKSEKEKYYDRNGREIQNEDFLLVNDQAICQALWWHPEKHESDKEEPLSQFLYSEMEFDIRGKIADATIKNMEPNGHDYAPFAITSDSVEYLTEEEAVQLLKLPTKLRSIRDCEGKVIHPGVEVVIFGEEKSEVLFEEEGEIFIYDLYRLKPNGEKELYHYYTSDEINPKDIKLSSKK